MSKIPQERKAIYYAGLILIIVGFILFLSVFFSFASIMNNPDTMFDKGPSFGNAIIGMIFIIIGGIVMNIGAKGAAGSGIILDPEKAREDLKPFNEAKGGMINDVISNVDIVDKLVSPQEEKQIIKIKCRSCGSLNDEDAKFCKSCGQEL